MRYLLQPLSPHLVCIILWTFLLVIPAARAQNATEFRVWVENKNSENPFFGQGWPEAFVVDGVGAEVGVQGRDLILERGVTYTIQLVNVPAHHPFYISTSVSGGGAGVYNDGVTGNFSTGNSVVTFTPGLDTPSLLYYQCGSHDFMGGRIHVIGEITVDLEPIAEGLTAPVYLTEAPNDSGLMYVVDQAGMIRIITPEGELLEEPFLDVRDRMVTLQTNFDERGLLGLAFHPEYASNGRFFIHYSAPLRDGGPAEWDHTAHISEFSVSDNPLVADPDSEQIIMQVDHPQFNHNGGAVAFGPDGYLYISFGDGGGSNDVGMGHVDDWYEVNGGGNGQAYDQNLLGSILRIDIETKPYGIPADNPFVDGPGLDEIWAFGLRNPYRMSFDSGGDNDLLTGDAGQGLWEAVYLIEGGSNYGWNVREGAHCFNTDTPLEVRPECPQEDPDGRPLVPPVIQYPHGRQVDGLGLVVVGGHVYRGSSIPELEGGYVFGDWSSSFGSPDGRVFVATERRDNTFWGFSELRFAKMPDEKIGAFVLGFGRDNDGEVYVLASSSTGPVGSTGIVYKLIPEPVDTEDTTPPEARIDVMQNHPNPFLESTTISFELQEATTVIIEVFDLLGRHVVTLLDNELSLGSHTVTWDGTNAGGQPVAGGIYIYHTTAGRTTVSHRMTLVR